MAELGPGGTLGEAGSNKEYTIIVMAGSATVDSAEVGGTLVAPSLLSGASGRAWQLRPSHAASVVVVVVVDSGPEPDDADAGESRVAPGESRSPSPHGGRHA